MEVESGEKREEAVVAAPSDKGKGVAEAEAEAEAVDGEKMVTVRSADGAERRLSLAAAEVSATIRQLIEDCGTDTVHTLPNIDTGKILDLVIEYCTRHAAKPAKSGSDDPSAATTSSSSVGAWDRDFVERLSMDDLRELLLAANYLNIKGLLELICQKAADMIKGKTSQQIRDTLNLPNDNTPDDEAELRRHQYAWGIDQ